MNIVNYLQYHLSFGVILMCPTSRYFFLLNFLLTAWSLLFLIFVTISQSCLAQDLTYFSVYCADFETTSFQATFSLKIFAAK
jgi:hypothetical protein